MHELSIVVSIINIAEEAAKKAGSDSIETIEVEIGKLSGIEFEALNFAWGHAVKGTMLEQAVKLIVRPQGKAICMDCGHEFKMDNLFDPCGKCKSHLTEIIQGREMRVKSITV